MIVNEILPIWLMLIICAIFICVIFKSKEGRVRRIIIVILLFVINLRIMIYSGDSKIITSNLDILFVIDNTISMEAEDYNGGITRLTAVKQDLKYIVDNFEGARFSIVIFGNESQILTPFTKDANMTIQGINTMQVANRIYATGSTPNIVLDDMLKILKTSSQKEKRKRIVFFISDGEITNGESLKSFEEVKKYIDSGAVLGYGTVDGGLMKVQEFYEDTPTYIEDRTSNKFPFPLAVSKIDETNLKKIANDIGVDYINMSRQLNVESKLSEIKMKYEDKSGIDSSNAYDDIYYMFVIPLLGLIVYEFIFYKRKL